ncbi:dipeptidase [soil metagenome]
MNLPPVFDGHNDVLLRLPLQERSFFERGSQGHLDLPRALEGGFGGGLFACYVPNPRKEWSEEDAITYTDQGYDISPAPRLDTGRAVRSTLAAAARLFRIETESKGKLKVVGTAAEIEDCMERGVIAAVPHVEGAEAIGQDLDELQVLYRAGLRSLGLVWSRSNIFGHGVPFRFPGSPDIGPGLTEAGRRLVRECGRLGIMLDLSHLNARGFWDVAGMTDKPLVATHSNAHALCTTPRNLTDDQLDAIRESGGMVGVNFASAFLRSDGRQDPDTPLAEIVGHVNHMVERMGVDHVGLGSDFDGATIPRELGDAAGLPRLLEAIRGAGYGEEELRKLAHANWLRVLRETWGE